MSEPTPIHLDRAAEHVDVEPGTEVILRGVYHSTFDGSEIDAATTIWPEGAPGGSSIDAGGLIDLAGGGFHLKARDPKTHEVVAVATGKAAPACEAAHVAAPCIALRSLQQARSRLMTTDDFARSLEGRITAEIIVPPAPPAYAPIADKLLTPVALGGALAVVVVGLAWFLRAKQKRSPLYQMRQSIRRVERKLATADSALSGALRPAVKRALVALDGRRIDPRSREGVRISEVLTRVETRLDESLAHTRAALEQEAADELVIEMESALEAADEVMQVAHG